MDERTISQLVEAMQKGEILAFEEIHRRYEKGLYFMAFKLTNNEADAMDMVQDTFIQMQSNIHTLRNPDFFTLWLKRILYNRCKNMFRKNRSIYLDDVMLDAMNKEELTREYLPEANAMHNAVSDILMKCIDSLNDLYAKPLYLKYYQSMTMDEIGSALHIPTGTVKSRLRTAKQLLKVEICRYEKENDMKVNFNGTTLGAGFVIALGLRRFVYASPTWLSASAITACVAIGGTISVMAITQLPLFQGEQKQENVVMQLDKQTTSSDMEAYFTLRNWAHEKEDILHQEDAQTMQVYFNQLKEHKGIYWELLQQDEWADTFLSSLR